MMSACKILSLLSVILFASAVSKERLAESNTLVIRKSDDFEINGMGTDTHWNKTGWISIPALRRDQRAYMTKAKVLYSDKGIYFLFFCEDKKLTATLQADFLDLWNEDVIEIFMQPDAAVPAYFEYELSPLNYELPIMIYNEKGKLNSWMPFHYVDDRKTRHTVTVQGGKQKSSAQISSWTSEIFIPYQLMKPLFKNAPASGTRWKGNLYRIDYDQGETLWAWQRNSGNFHEYDKFGFFEFE